MSGVRFIGQHSLAVQIKTLETKGSSRFKRRAAARAARREALRAAKAAKAAKAAEEGEA